MEKKRGDNELVEELQILKQRLDALEFKITSFDELENKIFDFFSNFESKVNEIIDKKIVDFKTNGKKYDELSKEVKELSKQAKSVISSISKTKGGKAIDFEKLLNARMEDLKENLLEKFDTQNIGDKNFLKFKDTINKKLNNISREFDDFQKETVPMEYVNMLETEMRNKFKGFNETLGEIKNKLPLDKNKLVATEREFDDFRKEVNDFRIKELLPERGALEDLNEEVEKIRNRINNIKEDELVPLELNKTKSVGSSKASYKSSKIKTSNDEIVKEKLGKIDDLQEEISKIKEQLNERVKTVNKTNDDSIKKDLGLMQDQISDIKEEISKVKEGSIKKGNYTNSDDSVKKDLGLMQDQISDIKEEISNIKEGSIKKGNYTNSDDSVKKDLGLMQDQISDIKEEISNIKEGSIEKGNYTNSDDSIEKDLELMQDQINDIKEEISNIKKGSIEKRNDTNSDDSVKKDLGLMQDQISDIKEKILKNNSSDIASEPAFPDDKIKKLEDSIVEFKKDMSDFQSQIEELKRIALTKDVDKNEKQQENSGFYKEFEEFKTYTIEQISKISDWLNFLNRCIK